MQLEIALSFGASLCGCVHEQEKGKEKGGIKAQRGEWFYFWGYGILKNIIEYCNLIPERNIFIKTTALGVKMLFNEAMLNSYNLCITKAINYVFVSKER